MTTQKVGAVKIPLFDKVNYEMWKKKMLLFLRVANPKYIDVLMNGPKIPMVTEMQVVVDNVVISPAKHYPKDPKDYTADEKEDSLLDAHLQLILIDCFDTLMNSHVLNCKDAKQMWTTMEIVNEGTEEVRENKMEILVTDYEHFRSNPGEGITEVFERYNRLINDLNVHGKYYTQKEINKKFLLTLPFHLEHKVSAIRESRDLSELSLERLYGVLKTYELEQIQQQAIYGGKGRVVSTSTALVAEAPQKQEVKTVLSTTPEKDVIVAEYGLTSETHSDGDFYSMEELENLEDESMAMIVKRFGNFRFRRNPNLKFKSNFNRFQRGGSSSSASTRGGYKTGTVERSNIRCYNCNELGHFATECRKPRKERKNAYESNQRSKPGKAYLAEGKSWDDTDSEDEEVGNLALMAFEDNHSSPKSEVTFTDSEMIYHLGSTLSCARSENDRIILQNNALIKENDELKKVHVNQDKLKEQVAFLENSVKCYKQLEVNLKEKITGLETKFRAYYNSCKTAKEIFNQQAISQTVGIGFDYNEAVGLLGINSPTTESAKEKGIPQVLKGVKDPLFRTSVAEPLDETSLIIQEEIRTEDIVKGLSEKHAMPAKDIKITNVQSNKSVPKGSAKVVQTTKTNLDTHKLEHNVNAPNMHTMPSIDASHKFCGVSNCMTCAFNAMFAYFNNKHASSDKTAPRQHVNSKKYARAKTASPPKARKETYVPKPKQKVVKAVYKVKCSVTEKVHSVKSNDVKIKNVVLPDKGQFFKYAGPNQVWVPKKV